MAPLLQKKSLSPGASIISRLPSFVNLLSLIHLKLLKSVPPICNFPLERGSRLYGANSNQCQQQRSPREKHEPHDVGQFGKRKQAAMDDRREERDDSKSQHRRRDYF